MPSTESCQQGSNFQTYRAALVVEDETVAETTVRFAYTKAHAEWSAVRKLSQHLPDDDDPRYPIGFAWTYRIEVVR